MCALEQNTSLMQPKLPNEGCTGERGAATGAGKGKNSRIGIASWARISLAELFPQRCPDTPASVDLPLALRAGRPTQSAAAKRKTNAEGQRRFREARRSGTGHAAKVGEQTAVSLRADGDAPDIINRANRHHSARKFPLLLHR
jgi:hypothetical protein